MRRVNHKHVALGLVSTFRFIGSVEVISLNPKYHRPARRSRAVEHDEVDYVGRVLRVFMAPIIDRESSERIDRLGTVVLIEDITEEKVLQRSRDEFFSIASHELRTPLTAIRGNASLVRRLYATKTADPEFDQMMEDIESSSIRLTEIVNDFLDVSRLEQDKIAFNFESFDFT